jgi:hypothetical protein
LAAERGCPQTNVHGHGTLAQGMVGEGLKLDQDAVITEAKKTPKRIGFNNQTCPAN